MRRCWDNVAPGVFHNAIDQCWTAEFLADTRHHMAVAIDDGQVVPWHPPCTTCIRINHPSCGSTKWEWLRRTNAKALIRALFVRGRELGCTEAWLGTEEDNTAARRLYAAVGGNEQPMVYVTFEL